MTTHEGDQPSAAAPCSIRWRPSRAPDDPGCDVYLTGTVFLDIIFTGLDSAPVRGTESWARGMGSSPGGVANMATALARLGLRTSLAAAFGDDHYGEYCWDEPGAGRGHRPLAVPHRPRLALPGHRLHGVRGRAHDGLATATRPRRPGARARLPAAAPGPPSPPSTPGRRRGVDRRRPPGTAARIFADVGWDDTGRWDLADLADLEHCEAFLPNAEEAMRYTRTDCPRAAARALAERVPLAVVTLGAEGAYAVDGRTGETRRGPGHRRGGAGPHRRRGRVRRRASSPARSPAGRSPTGSPSPG